MKPYVICHMITSVDGRILPGRWTRGPDGDRAIWSAAYAAIHDGLGTQGWIVGRVTMAEMSRAAAHPPANFPPPERPLHLATRTAKAHATALDPAGKLHFASPDIDGDAVVVLLGADVPNAHLAELASDGISYLVSASPDIDLAAALRALNRELGLRRLALEGGGGANGAFFAAGLVDELSVLIAPALDGTSDSRSLVEAGPAGLAGAVQLKLTSCEPLDDGLIHLRYAVLPG